MLEPLTARTQPSGREFSPLHLLKALAPPQTVLHIGAGTGQGELHQWHTWGVAQALLVDADPTRMAWAEQLAANHPGWQVSATLLAAADGTVTFHQASNPAEDGLVPAEQLRALWPNLRSTGQQQRPAQRLDTLLGQSGAPTTAHGNTWLLVDCLPALPLLQGAVATLGHCSVIAVRALLQPVDAVATGATLEEITNYLQGHGFKCVSTLECLQPALGTAMFVRDWSTALHAQAQQLAQANVERNAENVAMAETIAQVDRLRQQRSKLIADYDQLARAKEQLATERQASLAALRAQNDQLAQDATKAIAVHAQLTSANAELTAQRDAEAQAKAAAQADLATQTQLATERQASLAALQAQNDQLAQDATKAIAAHAQLTSANAELTAQRDAEAQAKAAAQADLATQTQLATERQASLAALQVQNEQLAQDATKAIAAHAELTSANAELTAQRDAEAQAKAAAQAEIATQNQLAAELQANLATARAERDALGAERNQISTAKDEQAQLATQRQQALANGQQEIAKLQERIQQLEAQAQESIYRQQMQQDEMIKAEAQIDLIKDLLLREPGL